MMGQSVNGSLSLIDIDTIITQLRDDINRDKIEVEQAVHHLLQMTARNTSANGAPNDCNMDQEIVTSTHVQNDAGRREILPPTKTNADCTCFNTEELLFKQSGSSLSSYSVVTNDMPAPRYGLIGLGEYEEKRKQYQQEWKEECQRHMSENAAQPRRKSRQIVGSTLDYEDILLKKRNEEHIYRNQNPTYTAASLRPFLSDNNLNNRATNGYSIESNLKFQPEARHAECVLDRIQGYDNQSLDDNELRDYTINEGTNTRPHSYPIDYNGVTHSSTDVGHQNGRTRAYDGRFSPSEYRRQLDDQMRVITERRQRELYKQDIDNYYQDASQIPTPIIEKSQESKTSRRTDDGIFITLDRTERATTFKQPYGQPTNMIKDYQADLALQVEASKQRKREQKAEELRYDMMIEEENRQYNPWGRGGGGAPVKDREGKTITVRGQLGNDRTRKVSIVVPTVEAGYLQRISPDAIPIVVEPRIIQTNYTQQPVIQQQTILRTGRAPAAAVPTLESYQEDLRRQIEDKRRREIEEKERERLEEEKLMKRVQEDNEKMKLEYEEELKKQKRREEERRRRNEELLQRQQEQKKEAERLKKEQREKERLEQWEERERALGRDLSPNSNGRLSPPVLGVNKTNARKMSLAADNAKLLLASTAPQQQQSIPPIQQQQQRQQRLHHEPTKKSSLSENKNNNGEPAEESREHVLSQLSAMRQQLEREQKVMQSQLRKEMMDDDYEVMGNKPSMPSRNRTSQQRRQLPLPIKYHPITNTSTTNASKGRHSLVTVVQPTIKTDEMLSSNRNNKFHQLNGNDHRSNADNHNDHVEPMLRKSHVLRPVLPYDRQDRVGAGHTQKTLKGDSFFLASGESDDISDNDNDHGQWHGRRNLQTWSIDEDLRPDAAPRRNSNRRNKLKQGESSDDIYDDSFLDEFMGRNLHRR